MPNFTIRRRKKKEQPQEQKPPTQQPQRQIQRPQRPQVQPTRPRPPPAEEKVDPYEETIIESSDEEYIDRAMSDLQIERPRNEPQKQHMPKRQPQYRPQTQPQYQERTNVVQQRPNMNKYDQHFGPTPSIRNPYNRKPTMPIHNPRHKRKVGVPKMRFRSHYGTGSEHYDTRTKSYLLYNHCFT